MKRCETEGDGEKMEGDGGASLRIYLSKPPTLRF